jgi:hypothetical protein
MAVALNLLSNVAWAPCNFLLKMIKLIVREALHDPKEHILLEELPGDIRTARKRFNLDPTTTVYATCPSCSFPHPLMKIARSNIDNYPARCSAKRYPKSKPCGARVTKYSVENGVNICVPIKPYAMQSFQAFMGGMLSCAGIENALIRGQDMVAEGEDIWDIMEGNSIRNLPGPDGKRFVDCTDEIRTVWSLSYDGFNPRTNKAAGKSTSVGSLAMMCLGLPPSLRYRLENIFLVGIIPGPKQPALDGLNLLRQLHVPDTPDYSESDSHAPTTPSRTGKSDFRAILTRTY